MEMNGRLWYFLLLLIITGISPSFSFGQTQNVPQLSSEDIVEAKKIAMEDKGVQSYIAGKSYSLMSYGLTTNEKTEPGVWHVTLFYNVENKNEMAVTLDLQKKVVVDVQYGPIFMANTGSPVEQKDGTRVLITLLKSFLPISVFAVGAAAIVAFFVLKRLKKQSAMA